MNQHARQDELEVPDLERRLSEHLASIRYEDLPGPTVEAARRAVMWFFATALPGSSAPGSDAVTQYALSYGGARQATIVGTGEAAPPALAAFANAVFAKAHEYEDKYWLDETGGFAIGFAVVPTILAVAEAKGGIGGRDVLTAVAAAIDFQARMLLAIEGVLSPARTGWNPTYLFSNYGAAAGAAKILGLDAARIRDTLGLVHAQACGNWQGQMEGVLGIRMQAGFAVRNGITAALLAQGGVTGAQQFFSGRFGYYKLQFPQYEVDYSRLTEGLGVHWPGERLGFKGYPCGILAHPVLDAVLQLRDRAPLAEITAIRVFAAPPLSFMAKPEDRRRRPLNVIDAQFSLPWAIACCLRDGMQRLDHFTEAMIRDPAYLDIAAKVTSTLEEGRQGATVEIELADGRVLVSQPVMYCRGHPENPVEIDEMARILRQDAALAAKPLDTTAAGMLAEAVLGIENLEDVRALFVPLLRNERGAA
jgi:2-methylcitrate dehydratase PrpD